MTKTVTLCFGSTNKVTRAFAQHFTLGDMMVDRSVQAALGFTAGSVVGQIGGVNQADTLCVPDGAVVTLVTKACEKA